MRFHVEVTREDIANATMTRNTAHSDVGCPIALAICRQVGQEPGAVWVGNLKVRFCRYGIASNPFVGPDALLPTQAIDFVSRFDRGDSVEPIAFPLDVPENGLANTGV